MTPGDFLRLVWPAEGLYCIAHPFKIPNTDTVTYSHKVFETISDAVGYVLQSRQSKDIYYTVLSLREKAVWDERKTDHKTGEKGAWAVRKGTNMLAGRVFFFDIDIGNEEKKYSTREEALTALKAFVDTTGLPYPMLVSSGGGFHVYWPIETALDVSAWKTTATQLRQLALAHSLRIDTARVDDVASVLRVPQTFNWKNPAAPRPVQVEAQGAISATEDFVRRVSDALLRAGVQPALTAPVANHGLGSNISSEYDGPVPLLADVITACKQMQLMLPTRGNIAEPAWYKGILNTVKFTRSETSTGRELAHIFSQGHPDYDKGLTDTKLDQLEQFNAPSRCATIAQVSPWGDSPCLTCPHRGNPQTPNPLAAARLTAEAPAPQVVNLAVTPAPTTIPNAPAPYRRLKDGGIAVQAKNSEGDDVIEVIYPYDLYPVRRLAGWDGCSEQQVWCVHLPRAAGKEFVLDADALYDSRKFVLSISNQGIYPHKSHLGKLQEYMVAYIAELQRLADADSQCAHLGWADDNTQFVTPDKILLADGSVKASSLSLGAQRATVQVHKKGTLQRQVELLNFFNHSQYIANQTMIVSSLAATIFQMTGYHGLIINASGEAGASKSTTLYTAASLWGHPQLYPINGTNSGATTRGRNERVATLANYPICVDEVTNMLPRDAVDMAMGITQPGHRIRLDTSGVERSALGSHKATIMLTTANSSLHDLLSSDNTQGTAGSMRVFELHFTATGVHQKWQADQFLRELCENYGHVGEVFVAHVLQNYAAIRDRVHAKMREIDLLAQIQGSERFWSGGIAVDIVACEIANELGLLSYDPVALQNWLVYHQIPLARGTVTEAYTSPSGVLADYIATIDSHIIVTTKQTGISGAFGGPNLASVLHEPRGALLGHYDRDTQVLYLLKQGFKDYCHKIGASAKKLTDALHQPHPATGLEGDLQRVVLDPRVRRTLGAGTDFAKTQAWVFVVNMKHPEVCDNAKLQPMSSVQAGTSASLAAND